VTYASIVASEISASLDILFIHPNFPGQFGRLAGRLAGKADFSVTALGDAGWMASNTSLPGVRLLSYEAPAAAGQDIHPYVRGLDAAVRRGQVVAEYLLNLKRGGYEPQVIYVHPGWGDGLFLKDLFPNALVVGLLEFFYNPRRADVGFDPEFPLTFNDIFRIRILNSVQLHALEGCDLHLSATAWQRSCYPAAHQQHIEVLHEGIDTALIKPNSQAEVRLPDGTVLRAGDEVLTYVSRGLEPYRGFHMFMRALPAILRERPHCQVVIVGEDRNFYGRAAPGQQTWRDALLKEVGAQLDSARVHFTGKLGYADYLKVLQVSRLHVYLTYPFVLSWSMLEAMATGCVLLASDTQPVREVVRDGTNGLLFPFFDTEALVAKAVQVLADPDPWLLLRENARATIRDFYDFDTVVYPRHLAIFGRLQNH
jgi:glycosyltransferase involved in cell wall biosynthesis